MIVSSSVAPKTQVAWRPAFKMPKAQVQGFSNVIVPLQHIGATEMAEILKPVATDRSFVRIDVKRNLLVLAGTQMQIEGWLDIVTDFRYRPIGGNLCGCISDCSGDGGRRL
jgi:general secretion pathway protein D